MIEVTEVNVYPIKKKIEGSYVVAFAKVTLNDELIVNGIRIVKGKKGPFLGFPQEYNKNEGRGYDICFPISLRLRLHISEKVIAVWDNIKEVQN